MDLRGEVRPRDSDGENGWGSRARRRRKGTSSTSREPVGSEDEKNQIWNAIKTVPDWKNDIVADIKSSPSAQPSAPRRRKTYTVKSGDTLSKIAKDHLGDANGYMKIFNANKDQLSDPDKIKPGQVLKIPV